VAVVGSQPLSVVCEPGANVLVFGSREDEVAISVVSARESVGEFARCFQGGLAHLIWVRARSCWLVSRR
jgi:hypothetical protein